MNTFRSWNLFLCWSGVWVFCVEYVPYHYLIMVLPSSKRGNDIRPIQQLLVSRLNWMHCLLWLCVAGRMARNERLEKVWLRGKDRQEEEFFRCVHPSCYNECMPSVSAPLLKTPSEKPQSHYMYTHSHTLPAPLIAAWAATFDILNQRTFTRTCADAQVHVSGLLTEIHTRANIHTKTPVYRRKYQVV